MFKPPLGAALQLVAAAGSIHVGFYVGFFGGLLFCEICDFLSFVTCVMSNMDISGGTRIPKLAYNCDYDDCGKLFVIRVEDFYLHKECPNCYMFLKGKIVINC